MNTENIQFYHDLHSRVTVAVLVDFTAQEIMDAIGELKQPAAYLTVGIAKVHPDDNYNKSIGREVSVSKMDSKMFIVGALFYKNKKPYVQMVHKEEDKTLVLTFSLKEGRDKPYFVEAYRFQTDIL